MAQESKAESGKRFARDMRRVRESRRLTLDDLHDETKIPVGLLEAFEETALFDHPQFNRVYLRSFVRTYANVLGIEPEIAIQALEEALSDGYTSSLAIEYLGEEADVSRETESAEESAGAPAIGPEPRRGESQSRDEGRKKPSEAATSDEEPATGKTPPAGEQPASSLEEEEAPPPRKTPKLTDKPAAADQPAAADEDAAHEATPSGRAADGKKPSLDAPTEEEEEEVSPSFVSTTGETAAGYERSRAEEEEETEWTTQSPPRPKRESTGYRKATDGANWRWVAGAAAIIVVAILVWIIMSVTGDGPSDAQDMLTAADTVATTDTTTVERTAEASPGPMPTLGDTMNVQIIAANGKVDPIRVTVDDDLRRPYWIEQGDSMTFRPRNRIVIEELLDNIALNIEGATYPTSRRDEAGRIVITRDSLRAYFGPNTAE